MVETEGSERDSEDVAGSTLALTVTGHTLAADGRGVGSGSAAAMGEGQPPARIGKYRIERALGAGGMGVVYLGRDLDLDRPVAVKLLGAGLTRGRSLGRAQARMRREARAMARLGHPHVVRVYEVGSAAGQLFVAMEYVDGQTLDAWLGAAERSWADIAAVFVQAGEGLLAAHEVGIVHRDFKPQNVMVEADRGASQLVSVRARVLDFGLAGAGDRPASSEGLDEELGEAQIGEAETLSEIGARLTMTGTLLGTPAYMAPEQFIGAPVDHRADQFGFCVALYEALYGRRPFAGQTLAELRLAVLAGDIRTPPLNADVPAWLRDLIWRGLASEPEDRWPSMRELLITLTSRLGAAVADDLSRSVGRQLRVRLFSLAGFGAIVVAVPLLTIFGNDGAQGLAVRSIVGAGAVLLLLVLLLVFHRTMLQGRYNRRATALLGAVLLGSFANAVTAQHAGFAIDVLERFNLILIGSLAVLATTSLERRMIAVAIVSIVAYLGSLWAPLLGGLGFVVALTLSCIIVGIGSTRERRSGGAISVSLRGSAARSGTG